MPKFDLSTATLGDVLDDPQAVAIVDKHAPGLSANPMVAMARGMNVDQALSMAGGFVDAEAVAKIRAEIEAL